MSFLNAFIAGGGAEALGGILNKAGIGQNAQAGGMFSGGFLDTSGAGGITPESVLSGQGGSVLDLASQAQQPQQSSGGGNKFTGICETHIIGFKDRSSE